MFAYDPFVRVVRASGTRAAIERFSGCALELALEDGSLAIHAHDLGGGELAVVTPDAVLRVVGTRFRVDRRGEGTLITVDEGIVAIDVDGVERGRATAGASVRISGGVIVEARGEAPSVDALLEDVPGTAPVASPGTEAAEAEPPSDGVTQGSGQDVRPGARRPDADELVVRAEQARRAGDLDRARALLRRAGAQGGYTAEAAWLSLARLELATNRVEAARSALATRRARFGSGALDAEATWLSIQIDRRSGRAEAAARETRRLMMEHPGTPQAQAARRLLEEERR